MKNKYVITYMIFTTVLYNISLHSMETNKIDAIPVSEIHMQVEEVNKEWLKQFGTLWKTDNFDFWHSPYQDPCANGITRFSASNTSETIKNINLIIDYAKKLSIPFSWAIDPTGDLQYIVKLLKENNPDKQNIMIHYLNNIAVNHVPELSIEPLEKYAIEKWLTVFNNAFSEYDNHFTAAYDMLIQKNTEDNNSPWKYYAGYFDQSLVATGTLFAHFHYGYIANIGTHPDYRRRGIATAITVFLLKEAKKLGLAYVLLQTSDATKMYEKIGFQVIAHLNEYIFNT